MGLSPTEAAAAGRLARRGACAAVLTVALVGLAAAPASAHTRARAATDFHSVITAAPALAGVQWRVYAGGEYLELTNTTGAEVLVLGYEAEPYLRIGPAGVFENRHSPAAYLNGDRYGDVAVPPRASPSAEPQWVQVSRGRSFAWHDHRVHWMSEALPPAVAAEPGRGHEIATWAVPFRFDGSDHELQGRLGWVPGAPWWPWALLGLVLSSPAALGAVLRRRPVSLIRPAAVTVATVAALNSLHFVDELLAWPAPILDVLFGLLHTGLFVGAGVVGAGIAWHGRYGPHLSLGIASGAVLFHQGLLQLQVLGASQLPTVWPPPLLRLAVAASVGQALWVAVVITRSLRTAAPEPGGAAATGADLDACPLPEVRPQPRSTV